MPGLASLNDGEWLTVVGVTGNTHVHDFNVDRPDPYEICRRGASRNGIGDIPVDASGPSRHNFSDRQT